MQRHYIKPKIKSKPVPEIAFKFDRHRNQNFKLIIK